MQIATYIKKGSALQDGQDFRGWLIGDLEGWTAEQGERFDAGRYCLRSTRHLEIKWAQHIRGEDRPEGWAPPSGKTTLSILVRGDFVLYFRDPDLPDQVTAHHLTREGEYVLWQEVMEHTWTAQSESIILTVRWAEAE